MPLVHIAFQGGYVYIHFQCFSVPLGNPHFRASTLRDHLREFVQFQDEVVASREEKGSSRKSGEAPSMPIEAVDEKSSVGSAEKSSTKSA
jgi:hypothetical protein